MKKTITYTHTTYVLSEKSPLKRLFIKVCFNDWFRILTIAGVPLLVLALIVSVLNSLVSVPVGAAFFTGFYILSLFTLTCFNDYETLNRIGKDVNGKPLQSAVIHNQLYYVKKTSMWRYPQDPEKPDSFLE